MIGSVAVFGSSEAHAGDALYEQAREAGRMLAADGRVVLTGGYGGVMEAASRGAREAGGRAVGVIASVVFEGRSPNAYLSRSIETPNLHERTRVLIESADAYLALHGKSGTLAEVGLVWALMRAGSLTHRPVLLLGRSWERVAGVLRDEGVLDGRESAITRVVERPEQVIQLLTDGGR